MLRLRLTPTGAFAVSARPPVNEISLEDWRDNDLANDDYDALVLPSDTDVSDLSDRLSGIKTLVLELPTFGDGRVFSLARLLRERYNFCGEICVRGDVLRDQVLFMARSGIDAFEVEEDMAASFLEALAEFSFSYQRAADEAEPVWALRSRRAVAA